MMLPTENAHTERDADRYPHRASAAEWWWSAGALHVVQAILAVLPGSDLVRSLTGAIFVLAAQLGVVCVWGAWGAVERIRGRELVPWAVGMVGLAGLLAWSVRRLG